MMYPLVKELADDGIAVTVSCRVLDLGRSAYYRWLKEPIVDSQLEEAYLANAIHDAHLDDPEFGYRFLADETRDAGHPVSDRVVWRICRDNQWWSVFGKPKRRKGSKPGTPAHDDLVRRQFTADAPNVLWIADITEHRTREGKLYCCAIKDVFSNRIVGWAIDSRMKARLVVAAIEMAVARRDGDVAGCIFHSDRGSSVSRPQGTAGSGPPSHGRLDGSSRLRRRQRRHGIVLLAPAKERAQPPPLADPRRTPHRDRDLDRTHLPPPPTPSPPWPFDPHRIRNHHDPTDGTRRLNNPCPLHARQTPTPDTAVSNAAFL
jgi:putative transposase